MGNKASTLSHAVGNAAARFPDRCAILLPGRRTLSFAVLHRLVEKAAACLLSSGVRPRDLVVLVFSNTLEFVVALLAVMRCRAVALPLDSAATRDCFERCLRMYQPKLLLVGPGENTTKEEAAAAALGVPHAVVSVRYPSNSVHISAFVLSSGMPAREGSICPAPPDISMIFNKSKDMALFLPSVSFSVPATIELTQKELVSYIGNRELAHQLIPVLPLFQNHGLLAGLFSSLAAMQRQAICEVLNEALGGSVPMENERTMTAPVGAGSSPEAASVEKAIEYALKLNELALALSTMSMINMSLFLMHHPGSQPTWVSTALFLFFSSFLCSLAGVFSHPLLLHSSVYVGMAALFTFSSGVAATAITVLPEKHSLLASAVSSVYVVLFTFLMLRGWPWRRHSRGQEQDGTAAAAGSAVPAATPGNIPAAAVAIAGARLTGAPTSGTWTRFTLWLSGKWSRRQVSEVSEEGQENSPATV